MSYINGAKISTDGLVYCVDAANPRSAKSGSNVWSDLSGYGNNLVSNNLTTTTLISGPTSSWQLQATTDFTDFFFKSLTSSSILQVSASYTVEGFCSAASSSNGDTTYSLMRVGTGSDVIFMFGLVCNSLTGFVTAFSTQYYNNGFRGAGSSTISVPFGKFNHYVITNSFGVYQFYLNGVYLNTVDNTASGVAYANVSAVDVKVGGSGSNIQDFSGKIAMLRVYNRPLSGLEVLKNYHASKSRFPQ